MVATSVYGGVLALSGLLFFAMPVYVAKRRELRSDDTSDAKAARAVRRSLRSPLLYLVGLLGGFLDARLAWVIFCARAAPVHPSGAL